MIRVLLADDHPMTRQGTRQILDGQPGLRVVGEAADGQEALCLAHQLQPDIVLLDISMPGINGIELAKTLRADLPKLHVIIMTGYEENDHYNDVLARLGVRGYLSKRATSMELVTALRAVQAGNTYFQGAFADLVSGPHSAEGLTAQERKVLRLVDDGRSNQEIAEQLYLSEPTVRYHLHNLFTKLGAERRTQLVSIARQRSLL
ncbi:MAG: response regulator transcription factor [Chloroflexota bacterium]|nr:response regulator transcription factor [Chloroflexota bacterium]